MRPRALTLALVLLPACGTRSALDLGGRATGQGGAPATSGGGQAGSDGDGGSGGAGGVGGAGGAVVACSSLTLTGEPVPLPTPAGGTARIAQIKPLPDGRAVVVHLRFQPGASFPLARTVLDWQGSWPPAVDGMGALAPGGGFSFAIERGPSPWLAMVAGSSPSPPGLAYAQVPAEAGAWQPNVALASDANGAVFLRAGGDGRLFAGMQASSAFQGSPAWDLLVGWVHQPPNGIQYEGPYGAGCSPSPTTADGLYTSSGWLLARAGLDLAPCLDDTPPGPANAVRVTRYTPDGLFYGLEQPMPGWVTQLALLPSPAGAWLLTQHDGGVLSLLGADHDGLLLQGPTAFAGPPAHKAYGFSAAALDGGAIVAFPDEPAGPPADLSLIALDSAGHISAEAAIEGIPLTDLPTDVHVDPQTRQILVAYSSPDNNIQVMLARFACE